MTEPLPPATAFAAAAAAAHAVHIRPLVAADAVAYKSLRDEALRTAPDAFTSDYAASVGRPAKEYAVRFGPLESGVFFLGAFNAAGQLLGCVGCERCEKEDEGGGARSGVALPPSVMVAYALAS